MPRLSRITVEAALRHYTRDAAYASFDEARKGSIAVGKYADFVVLSDDILAMAPQKLLQVKVLLTVMSGRETYRVSGSGGVLAGPSRDTMSRAESPGTDLRRPGQDTPGP